jgi:hypothetical protein
MYQPNFSNQQAMSQQNQGSQQNQQANEQALQEQDWGKLLLGELKRVAREYTTAALEASHSSLCQTFQSLAQKTMQDQARLFSVLSQMNNGYSSIPMAHPQEIQQELQQRSQKAEQLQSLVQQCVQGEFTSGAGMYQQPMEQQTNLSYPSMGQAGASQYGSYSNNSAGTSSGFTSGQSAFQGAQGSSGSQGGQGSQGLQGGYTQGYGQGYSSGYTNTMSNANPYSGKSSSFQAPASSTFNNNLNSSFTGSDNTEPTRGGNSFNWTAPDESENSSSSGSSPSSSNQSGSSGSKYIL